MAARGNVTKLSVVVAGMMARNLDLQRGGNRFIKTAAYGHFGRDDPDFTWEKVRLEDCSFPREKATRSARITLPFVLRRSRLRLGEKGSCIADADSAISPIHMGECKQRSGDARHTWYAAVLLSIGSAARCCAGVLTMQSLCLLNCR